MLGDLRYSQIAGDYVAAHQAPASWVPPAIQFENGKSYGFQCKEKEKFTVLQSFPLSSWPFLLPKVLTPCSVKVDFVSWNPLIPPAIPPGASILWLECKELTSGNTNQRNTFGNNNQIASWPLSGSVFNGEQHKIKLNGLPISKFSFSLWTNLGEVVVVEANQVIISLRFHE